jgi:hypothetical protein
MPAVIKSLLGLALFFGRLQAELSYETLCSSPPSQPEELGPGVTATYQCDHAFYTADWNGGSSFARTPKECALQCAQWSSEGRCGWQSDTCYQYNAGKNSAPRAGGVAIYIKKTTNSVPDCSTITQECNRNLTANLDTIKLLQHEKEDCETLLSTKRTDLTKLEGEKQQLQSLMSFMAPRVSLGDKICRQDFLSSEPSKSSIPRERHIYAES